MAAIQQLLASYPAPSAGASWRYWRLYITALNSSGTQVRINEVELRGTAGGADLTTGATPVLESTFLDNGEEGSHPGSATVDGDTTFSYWSTAAGVSPPHWLRYDLATAQTVAQVALHASSSASECPRDFKIQGSSDGSSWTDVKSFSGTAAWVGWQAFTL